MPHATRTRPTSAAAALAAAQSETPTAAPAQTRYIPVPRWNDHHDWPPPGGLRHLIFHASTNGFSTAFKRVGRRVLVDEAEFFRCVERANRKVV